MKLSTGVVSIRNLRSEASKLIRHVAASKAPVIITVNGEAAAVLQDVASYRETQSALALLKILALADKCVKAGSVRPATAVFKRVRRTACRAGES